MEQPNTSGARAIYRSVDCNDLRDVQEQAATIGHALRQIIGGDRSPVLLTMVQRSAEHLADQLEQMIP